MSTMKTATAFMGDTCYRCENPAWSVCFVCQTKLCAYHGWEVHLHAQRLPAQLRGNAIDVTHKFICTDCLLRLVDHAVGSSGRHSRPDLPDLPEQEAQQEPQQEPRQEPRQEPPEAALK